MSDSGTAGHLQPTGTAQGRGTASVPEARRCHPVAVLVVDTATGEVTAANPAGRRRVAGTAGAQLTRWLAALATTSGRTGETGGDTTVRAWHGAEGARGGVATAWVQCTVVEHRSRRSLLVVVREDRAPHGADVGRITTDPSCAVFTLDAVGRIDSWGPGAQRWTGFSPEDVIGSDTTLLHPGPGRLAGEPHRALTHAYRTGEHRAEGWRMCSDGRTVWAETTTCALYDGRERLLGFVTVMQDLTAARRLVAGTSTRVPAPRRPLATRPMRPSPARPAAGNRPGRIPGQRRP